MLDNGKNKTRDVYSSDEEEGWNEKKRFHSGEFGNWLAMNNSL